MLKVELQRVLANVEALIKDRMRWVLLVCFEMTQVI